MTDIVFFGGDVYSSADPFATAAHIHDDTVAWVGEDEAAATLGGEHIALADDLLTPAFVHAGLRLGTGAAAAPSGRDLVDAGILSAHVIGPAADVEAFSAGAPEELSVVAYPLLTAADAAEAPAGSRCSLTAPDAVAVLGSPSADVSAFVVVEDDEELTALLTALADDAARTRAQRGLWRILLTTRAPLERAGDLARAGLGVTLDPTQRQPLAALFSAGAQVSFALAAANPWESLAAAVRDRESGISGRAAFNAATRFAHRALGSFEGGVIAPGARADAVRWEVGELIVQAADSRLAAWSTDPRSGTPGLPDLSEGATLPTPVAVVAEGRLHRIASATRRG